MDYKELDRAVRFLCIGFVAGGIFILILFFHLRAWGAETRTFDLSSETTMLAYAQAQIPYPIRSFDDVEERNAADTYCVDHFGDGHHGFGIVESPTPVILCWKPSEEAASVRSGADLRRLCGILAGPEYETALYNPKTTLLSCARRRAL